MAYFKAPKMNSCLKCKLIRNKDKGKTGINLVAGRVSLWGIRAIQRVSGRIYRQIGEALRIREQDQIAGIEVHSVIT